MYTSYVGRAQYHTLLPRPPSELTSRLKRKAPPRISLIVVQSSYLLPAQGVRKFEPYRIPPELRVPLEVGGHDPWTQVQPELRVRIPTEVCPLPRGKVHIPYPVPVGLLALPHPPLGNICKQPSHILHLRGNLRR